MTGQIQLTTARYHSLPFPASFSNIILHHTLINHLDQHHVLTNNQHGFGRGRTSETRLAGLIDDHAQILDRKSQNGLVILDFIKAFDTVSHQWLMSKLENIGIDYSLLRWIETFLT